MTVCGIIRHCLFVRRFSAGLAALFFLTVSHAFSESTPTVVRVFSLPEKGEMNPPAVAAYRVMEHFLELNPGIKLEASSKLQIEGAVVDAAPLMAIAGGTSPDVLAVNLRQSDTYIRQGFLYPLDEYIAQLSPKEREERIPAAVWPAVERKGPDGANHFWAMPEEVVVRVLLYRKDLFAQAGLDPDRPPRNWKEMADFATRLADPSARRYGLFFQTGPAAAYDILPLLLGAGARAVAQKPDGNWEAVFDTPEAVTAYAFADQLRKAKVVKNGVEGPVAYVGSDAGSQKREGRVGMFFDILGKTSLSNSEPDVMAVAPVPVGPSGVSCPEINAHMLGIYAGVADKKVRDAAWEYIKFVSGPEARRIYTRTMVELGAAHLLNPVWLEEFGFPELAASSPPGMMGIYREALRQGVPEPYGENCQFIYDFMSRPLEKLYYTNLDGKSAEDQNQIVQRYLAEAVRETNERMLGQLSPAQRNFRNGVAWAVVGFVSMIFGVVLYLALKWMGRQLVFVNGEKKKSSFSAVVFVVPALLLMIIWQYYPLLRGLTMAFQDYNIMGGSPWVGINNFGDVLFDGRFWASLKNAFYFCALWMLLGFFPPVALAVILQEVHLGKMMFRILFYVPAMVSGVVILFMWRAIYDSGSSGVLNRLLALVNIPSQTWLQDPKLAMICIVFPLAWANLGPGSIIYLAALKGIPHDLYEAAEIDGAAFVRKLACIVLPYLKPLLVINAVGSIIFGFKSGDAILAMTGGGPDGSTLVVGYEIWQRSFLFLQFGQATAMAWLVGLILLAFTAYQMRVLARVEFRTAG